MKIGDAELTSTQEGVVLRKSTMRFERLYAAGVAGYVVCMAPAALGYAQLDKLAIGAWAASMALLVAAVLRIAKVADTGSVVMVQRLLEAKRTDSGYRDGAGRSLTVDGVTVPSTNIARVQIFFVVGKAGKAFNVYLVLKSGWPRAYWMLGNSDEAAIRELGTSVAETLDVPFLGRAQQEDLVFTAAFALLAIFLIDFPAMFLPAAAVLAGVHTALPVPARVALVAGILVVDRVLPHLLGLLLRVAQRRRALRMFS